MKKLDKENYHQEIIIPITMQHYRKNIRKNNFTGRNQCTRTGQFLKK